MKKLAIGLISVLLLSCNPFDPNKKHIEREYYPDGSIKSEIEIENGMRNGTTKLYAENGRLLSTSEYVNDKREGWLINYNTEIQKPELKGFFKNDTQVGPVTQYYREGMLFRESNYVKGRIDGVVKTYWPNGKLKAENFYKMGKPAIGLKEYDKNGNLIIDQPKIVIQEINQLALLDRVLLKISISGEADNIEFYNEELLEGKYIPENAYRLQVIEGVATIEYPVARGAAYKKRLSIIAKFRTKYGNTMVACRHYDLMIMNVY